MIPTILALVYLSEHFEYALRAYLLKKMLQDNDCTLMQEFYVLSLF
jgi:hypothetical protein